jgi:putative PIN family toxin of toxin-antitoxin system
VAELAELVVYDTNVWVSGLLWRGKPYQCVLLARAGLVRVAYCRPMLAELTQKLREKFNFSENRIQAVVYQVQSVGEQVKIEGRLHVVADDRDDDKFVECAIVAGASLIVSSDRHLLALKEYRGINNVTPAEFIVRMSKFD